MTEQTTIRIIVAKWLLEHGYDGLTSGDCGCGPDDFMTCDQPYVYCAPAYRWTCPCELRSLNGGELCPEPFDDYEEGCYRAERQPEKEEKS